jgi:hypothetical protein
VAPKKMAMSSRLRLVRTREESARAHDEWMRQHGSPAAQEERRQRIRSLASEVMTLSAEVYAYGGEDANVTVALELASDALNAVEHLRADTKDRAVLAASLRSALKTLRLPSGGSSETEKRRIHLWNTLEVLRKNDSSMFGHLSEEEQRFNRRMMVRLMLGHSLVHGAVLTDDVMDRAIEAHLKLSKMRATERHEALHALAKAIGAGTASDESFRTEWSLVKKL